MFVCGTGASMSNQWALYGGAGFIGQHLARSILERWPQDRVHLVDIQAASAIRWKLPLQGFINAGRLQVRQSDVRDAASLGHNACAFDVIVNLAAVHREPGHRPAEYFDTNVAGAENICRLAQEVGCREILFTSSISVYGIHGRPVDEDSAVQPRTPYGQSKHQAEQIHQDWARRSGGRLTIIRPGVVFGAGEEGNVTRLVAEMRKRHRAIRVQPDQPKAGIYVEELIDIMHWLRRQPLVEGESQLVNGVSKDPLTFNAYADVLQAMHGWTRPALDVPGALLGALVAVMNPLAGLFPTGSRIHPRRLEKLLSANDVRPGALTTMGYPFSWPLERALADWLAKGL